MDLTPLHLSFSDLETHTQVLAYALALGPVLLLALVTWVQLRRTGREPVVGGERGREAPRSNPGR